MIKNMVLISCLATSAVLGFAGGDAAFAETVLKMKAQGVNVGDIQNFKLTDGSTTQLVTGRTVWTGTEGDMAGQSWSVTCHGLGKVTADGVYSSTNRCEETHSAEDTINGDYKDTAEGGDWVITGGTGKYKGATGGGHITYTWGDTVFGDRITMTYEGTITLP